MTSVVPTRARPAGWGGSGGNGRANQAGFAGQQANQSLHGALDGLGERAIGPQGRGLHAQDPGLRVSVGFDLFGERPKATGIGWVQGVPGKDLLGPEHGHGARASAEIDRLDENHVVVSAADDFGQEFLRIGGGEEDGGGRIPGSDRGRRGRRGRGGGTRIGGRKDRRGVLGVVGIVRGEERGFVAGVEGFGDADTDGGVAESGVTDADEADATAEAGAELVGEQVHGGLGTGG